MFNNFYNIILKTMFSNILNKKNKKINKNILLTENGEVFVLEDNGYFLLEE